MKELSFVPQEFLKKAAEIIELFKRGLKRFWKKLAGVKSWYSYRLDMNYRVLTDGRGNFFVGCHDAYENKIKNLKRFGH